MRKLRYLIKKSFKNIFPKKRYLVRKTLKHFSNKTMIFDQEDLENILYLFYSS